MEINVEDLKKIPPEPAARLLAKSNVKLGTQLESPASASVTDILKELAEQDAGTDAMQLLAVALPTREAVWWACLAAEDLVGEAEEDATPSLGAAKAWVHEPDTDHKVAARVAMESADFDDDTVYCAMAAYYADGTLGTGDQAEQPAPPGAVPGAVFAQNMLAIGASQATFEEAVELLIARALDIARGGNGRISEPDAGPTEGDI